MLITAQPEVKEPRVKEIIILPPYSFMQMIKPENSSTAYVVGVVKHYESVVAVSVIGTGETLFYCVKCRQTFNPLHNACPNKAEHAQGTQLA